MPSETYADRHARRINATIYDQIENAIQGEVEQMSHNLMRRFGIELSARTVERLAIKLTEESRVVVDWDLR